MPTTNRPFFSNFFAAFRAHSALQKTSPALTSSPTTSSVTRHYHASAAAAASSPSPGPSTAESIAAASLTKQTSAQSIHGGSTSPSQTTMNAPPQSHFRSSRPLHAPTAGTPHGLPRARSTSTTRETQQVQPLYSHSGAEVGRTRSPSPNPLPLPSQPSYFPQQQRPRRGSDTTEGSVGAGFGVLGASPGAEKWYIGGRTAGGEERFYKLGLVKTTRSADRLSLDRLSL